MTGRRSVARIPIHALVRYGRISRGCGGGRQREIADTGERDSHSTPPPILTPLPPPLTIPTPTHEEHTLAIHRL